MSVNCAEKLDLSNLKTLIDLSGMTYNQIADDCGLGTSTIYLALNGRYNPSVQVLCRLADYFNVPIDYLIGRVSEEQKDLVEKDYYLYFRERLKFAYEFNKSICQKKPAGYSFEIPEGYEAPWPYNLISDIFENDDFWIVSDDQEAGLEFLLDKMSPRTKLIIYRRYKDCMKLEDISKEFGITKERVRQIIVKAIRILRAPTRKKYIEDGLEGTKELDAMQIYISKRRRDLEQMKAQLLLEEQNLTRSGVGSYDRPFADIFLDECDMSVRLFNCLRRAELNTVNQIVAAVNDGRILEIRNLGRKTYEELLNWLKSIGVPYDSTNGMWGMNDI